LTISACAWIISAGVLEEVELIAQELAGLAEKTRALEKRMANVEKMNARLEQATLTTRAPYPRSPATGMRSTRPCAAKSA
jgi:hypothetical protein